MVSKLICIIACAFSKERQFISLWRGKGISHKLLRCPANHWVLPMHVMKNNIQLIESSDLERNPLLSLSCLKKQFITVSINSFHQAIDRSWEEPFSNHLITDMAVESFIYTFSDKGKLFALSSPSQHHSKAVECLEVSIREVAVYKSHQAKPVITESISSLDLFLFHICKMFHLIQVVIGY